MNTASDPALREFTAELLEKYGGVVERKGECLLTLLPAGISERLQLPEETCLGTDESPLLYGSPVLDRIIKLVTDEVPIVYGQVAIPYLKRDGFDRALAEDLTLMAGRFEIIARAETLTSYMILVCHYVALSDERKEGLVRVAVNDASGALIPELEAVWTKYHVSFYEDGTVPDQFSSAPDKALKRALDYARANAETALGGFLDGMRRRLRRDVLNTREYYEALAAEMEAGLSHPHLTDSQREERRAKLADLPREMANKVEDLKQKYSVRVSITGRAAMRLLVPVVQLMTRVRYRKCAQELAITWNPVTRKIDPLVCTSCGRTMSRIFPCEDKSGLKMVCGSCGKDR